MSLSFGVEAGADAEASKDNAFLDIFGKIRIACESVAEHFRKEEDKEAKRLARLPQVYPLEAVTPSFTGTQLVDLGGPMPGRQWHVRKLSAVTVPLAANASVVTWYAGQIMPGPAAGMLPATMEEWQFPSVPAFEDFSKLTFVILP